MSNTRVIGEESQELRTMVSMYTHLLYYGDSKVLNHCVRHTSFEAFVFLGYAWLFVDILVY